MIRLEFTDADRQDLEYERFHHPHPRVQLKMEVLWLKSLHVSHEQICQIAKVSPNTLRTYLREFEDGGICRLKTLHFRKPTSSLEQHAHSIEAYFRQHPPASIQQAQAMIVQQTGIKRNTFQIRK